jgi:hypothetical protein
MRAREFVGSSLTVAALPHFCSAAEGKNIAPTIVLNYMMQPAAKQQKHLSLLQAYNFLGAKAPGIKIEDCFMSQLLEGQHHEQRTMEAGQPLPRLTLDSLLSSYHALVCCLQSRRSCSTTSRSRSRAAARRASAAAADSASATEAEADAVARASAASKGPCT